MKTITLHRYYDRNSRCIINEKIFGQKFLFWSYNTTVGRFLTTFVLSHRFVSWLYGRWANSALSRPMVRKFALTAGIDTSELDNQFTSFNKFFTRKLVNKPVFEKNSTGICFSPASGKILVFDTIEPDKKFQIKRNQFNLKTFLRQPDLIHLFANGSMAIIRLSMYDYHYIHFPDSGYPIQYHTISGKYYAGNSYSFKKLTQYFSENYRVITILQSDHFGEIAIVEIGAFCVGSIKQYFNLKQKVASGDIKGRFELGGSTVVLLFQQDTITFDKDIIEQSIKGMETSITIGDRIGIRRELS